MKKILFFVFILCTINTSFSQKEKPLNNPIYDNQGYHFGFTLGLSQTKFQINYSNMFSHQNEFDQLLSKYDPGFNVGIIIDVKLLDNINLRLTPSFNFSDQKLYYTKDNVEYIEPNNNTGISNFEIPIYFKYRSDRINNGRIYLLLGGKFTLDMTNSDKLTENENLIFKKTNYSIDCGFGIDFYFAYFKFSPEIKYSYGLRNMLVDNNNEYSNLINSLYTRGIFISLTFE